MNVEKNPLETSASRWGGNVFDEGKNYVGKYIKLKFLNVNFYASIIAFWEKNRTHFVRNECVGREEDQKTKIDFESTSRKWLP